MKRIMAMGLLAIGLAACGGENNIEDELRDEQKVEGPPPYAFTEQFPDIMEFEQGFASSYNLLQTVQVPEGEPVLTLENLPEGATFDGKTLTWLPPCDLPESFFPRGYGMHYIRSVLKSSVDESQYVKRRVLLFVHKFQVFPDRKCGIL